MWFIHNSYYLVEMVSKSFHRHWLKFLIHRSRYQNPALNCVVYVISLSNLMDRRCERASWFLNGVFKVYRFIWHAKILFRWWLNKELMTWGAWHSKHVLTLQSSKSKYKICLLQIGLLFCVNTDLCINVDSEYLSNKNYLQIFNLYYWKTCVICI